MIQVTRHLGWEVLSGASTPHSSAPAISLLPHPLAFPSQPPCTTQEKSDAVSQRQREGRPAGGQTWLDQETKPSPIRSSSAFDNNLLRPL